jgi:hypothetical protein
MELYFKKYTPDVSGVSLTGNGPNATKGKLGVATVNTKDDANVDDAEWKPPKTPRPPRVGGRNIKTISSFFQPAKPLSTMVSWSSTNDNGNRLDTKNGTVSAVTSFSSDGEMAPPIPHATRLGPPMLRLTPTMRKWE